MAKVLFIESWSLTPHLETAFELAQRYCDAGDTVRFLFCGQDTLFREGLSLDRRAALYLTRLPERKAASLVRSDRFEYRDDCLLAQPDLGPMRRFDDLDQLMQFEVDGFEAGLAVASSLVSQLRNSNPDTRQLAQRIWTMVRSAVGVHRFAREQIAAFTPDLVYTFNGRFCNARGVYRAAQQAGVPVRLHERGADKGRFVAYPFLPHDQRRIQERMLETWQHTPAGEKEQVAERFFTARRSGQEQGWTSFVLDQKKNRVPEFDPARRIVTYFSSSDDEFVAVGDVYRWTGWKNQMAAVQDLIRACREAGDVQLFVRLHPHLRQKSREDQATWLALREIEGVHVISFDSEVDTYAMIERSDLVVSCGSTVGAEAVYWGTPSISLGPTFYSMLGATYRPQGYEELRALVGSQDLQADRSTVLPYGYYFATFGEPFQHYRPQTLFRGEFMGVDLQEHSRAWQCWSVVRHALGHAVHLVKQRLKAASAQRRPVHP